MKKVLHLQFAGGGFKVNASLASQQNISDHPLKSSFNVAPQQRFIQKIVWKLISYLLKILLYLFIFNFLGINSDTLLMDSDSDTETEKPKDKGKGKLIEETETEKPKDKGKGKLIENTQEGQSSSYYETWSQKLHVPYSTDDEHKRLIELRRLINEKEVLMKMDDRINELLNREKEEYEKTGFIDTVFNYHSIGAEQRKTSSDVMNALQQKIDNLKINDNDKSKFVGAPKRSIDSVYGYEKDLGGPSQKPKYDTKYDSDSSSDSNS